LGGEFGEALCGFRNLFGPAPYFWATSGPIFAFFGYLCGSEKNAALPSFRITSPKLFDDAAAQCGVTKLFTNPSTAHLKNPV